MLAIFPASSIDNSILTPVLVGLFILWFFQETLGWNFTGIVVPGYLASVFVIDPTTALVVVLEALAAVGVVTMCSERVPRWWAWTPLFGRDRFLLFLVASVGIRVLLEGLGFTAVAGGLGLRLNEGLHSMGLVLVPLLGNALWRGGVGGAVRVAVPVALTWMMLRFVLLPHTNLSLSSFELTYENLALDFLGSPRAFIVLVVAAALASQVNLRWGWDFGGIIVPALLALCWWQPERLFATIGESAVIAVLYVFVTRLPFLRSANITGGRPIVLAFSLGYLWRFGLATLGGEVRDFLGFGYLLSAILALRFVKHGQLWRASVPALATSAAAFIGASMLAWILAIVLPQGGARTTDPAVPLPDAGPWALADVGWSPSVKEVDVESVLEASLSRESAWSIPAGLLWRRPGGRLGLVATVGPVGMDLAAIALAERVNAGALLLCSAPGSTCTDAAEALEDRMAILRLAPGEDNLIRLPGGTATSIDLGLLAQAVGQLPVVQHEDRAELVLNTATLLRVASDAVGIDPLPVVDIWQLPTDPAQALPKERRSAIAFRGGLLAPLARALSEGSADALRVVAGASAARGLVLEHANAQTVLRGPGWRFVDLGTTVPLLVHIPDAVRYPAMRDLARAFVRESGARFLLEEAPGAAVEDDTRWGMLAAREALLWLGPEARVVTFRPIADAKDPGVDVVLQIGRRVFPGALPPPLATAVQESLVAAGLSVGYHDGTAQRLPYIDPNDLRRAAWANATESAQVTVFVRGRAAADLRQPLGRFVLPPAPAAAP